MVKFTLFRMIWKRELWLAAWQGPTRLPAPDGGLAANQPASLVACCTLLADPISKSTSLPIV